MVFSLRKLKTLLWFWLQQTENLKLERVCNGPLPDRLITFFDHLALGSNHLPLFILSFDLFFCFTCTLQSFILTGISWSRVTMRYSMNYSNNVILTQWGTFFMIHTSAIVCSLFLLMKHDLFWWCLLWQVVVEKKIMRERRQTRHDLGREKFVSEVWLPPFFST